MNSMSLQNSTATEAVTAVTPTMMDTALFEGPSSSSSPLQQHSCRGGASLCPPRHPIHNRGAPAAHPKAGGSPPALPKLCKTINNPGTLLSLIGRAGFASKSLNDLLASSSSSLTSKTVSRTGAQQHNCSTKKKKKKQVQFVCDSEGRLQTTVFYQHWPTSLVDPQELWWSSQELQDIRWECNNIVNFFKLNQDYVRLLQLLYCGQTPEELWRVLSIAPSLLSERTRGLEPFILGAGTVGLAFGLHQEGVFQALDEPTTEASVRQQSQWYSTPSRTFASAMATLDFQEAAVEYAKLLTCGGWISQVR